MAEQGGDGLQPHAAVDGLGGQRVAQPVRVHAGNPGGPAHAGDDAADEVAVQRAAVISDQPLAAADVLQVGGGPGGEQLDELGVQRDVAVVAELAERDPQPVPGADLDDRVGLQVREFAGPHAGAGQQLDDQPVAGISAGPGRGHQLGGVAVIEEPGQRLGLFRDVPGDDRVAGRRVGPVPLDDPLEELAYGPHPLAMRLGRDRLAAAPGLDGEPYLVVLDVITAHRGDTVQPGIGGQPPGELAQRVLRGGHAARGQERGQPLQVPLDRRCRLRCRGLDLRPLRGGDAAGHRPASGRAAGRQRAHRTATVWTASISATAAVSASISSAARRYSPASQSLARCR
jgi:hypothetical protein